MSEAVSQVVTTPAAKSRGRKIPGNLIREAINGHAFYYPDFRAVLNKSKSLEEVMADRSLQWTLKKALVIKSKLNLIKNATALDGEK